MNTQSTTNISVSSRIRNAILGLAISLCVVFGGLMFMTVFIVEDAVFVKQMHAEHMNYKRALTSGSDVNWQPTNGNMRMVTSVEELSNDLPTDFLAIVAKNTGIHEYFDQQQALFISHQYNLGLSSFLLYDVSSFLAVRGSKTALFSFILILTLLASIASVFIANYLTRNTLAPIKALTNEIQLHGFNKSVVDQARQFTGDEIGMLTHELALAIESQNESAKREFEFNRGVSHELRSPIQAAQSSCELLIAINQQQLGSQSPLHKPLMRLQRATDEMNEIAHAFLMLSNEHANNAQQHCSLNELLELCDSLHITKISTTLSATHSYPMHTPVLRIIIRHLIRNANTHGISGSAEVHFFDNSITVKNKMDHDVDNNTGFGVGLNVVETLCERNGHGFTAFKSDNDRIFSARVVFNS